MAERLAQRAAQRYSCLLLWLARQPGGGLYLTDWGWPHLHSALYRHLRSVSEYLLPRIVPDRLIDSAGRRRIAFRAGGALRAIAPAHGLGVRGCVWPLSLCGAGKVKGDPKSEGRRKTDFRSPNIQLCE